MRIRDVRARWSVIVCAMALAVATSASAQVPGLTGTLIVTNKTPSTATLIDVASGRTLATLPTGTGPHEVALSSSGRVAVVTDYGGQGGGSTLTVIDVPGMRVARKVDMGQYRRPHGVRFLSGDSLVVVTSEASQNVVIVNVAAGEIRRAIETGHAGSHMVGVTSDGVHAWTGNIGGNSVTELNLRTGENVRTIDVPAQPEAINVTPDGSEVWVGSNATGKVSVVDTKTGKVTTAAEGFGWPYRMLFTPDMKAVFMPDLRNEEVRVVDRASRRELARIPFEGAAPQGITITPDGRYVFLSLSGQSKIAIIDVASRKVVDELAAGETPDGIAYTVMRMGGGS